MKHKVLCIDDETHNLEALERLLRKKYDTICVSSGPDGIKELNNHNFSLIISDQKMPEMTGVQFFMEAKKVQPEAVRILLTGYTDLESVINAINQGQIYRYITKPWEPEEFLSIVAQGIEVFEMKGTIARQNRELQKANEELQSLDKLKTDFMMLVNHELKTPLTGIFSFVQLLNEEELSPEQKLYIDKISKNTKRLQDLINDTLLITRIKAATKDLDQTSVDIHKVILENWNETVKEHPGKSLNLKLNSEGTFEQTINENYIRIVIKKLIQNCFAHSTAESTIDMTLESHDDSWSLTSENEMLKELDRTPQQLLNAFSTDQNILNHSGGTGLGLAVMQAIVNLFGGSISIAAENQQFKIKLSFPEKK